MASVSEALGIAYEHHRGGRRVEAEILYGRILHADPGNSTALMLLGALLIDMGRIEEAVGHLEQVIRQDSRNVDAHYNLAVALERLGRPNAAEAHYLAVLQLDPYHAHARNNLGLHFRTMHRSDLATKAFRATVTVQPGFGEAWFNLGAAWANRDHPDKATTALERALTITPDLPPARNHLERLQKTARRRQKLSGFLERGGALIRAGQNSEGLRSLLDAMATASPDDLIFLVDAAIALKHDAPKAALAAYWACSALSPDNAHTNLLLGILLSDDQRFFEAIGPLTRAVRLAPTDMLASATLGRVLFQAGLVESAIGHLAFATKQPGVPGNVHDDYLFALLTASGIDNEELFAAAKAANHAGLPVVQGGHANAPDPERRIRIGYVSGMIREGSNALLFLGPLLANHDRNRVAVFVYGDVDYAAPAQANLVGMVDGARSLRGLNDAEAAHCIRADGIDVLVSLLGRGSLLPRNGVFAYKPAPVQLAFHHVMTTATATMDYWLTDRQANPGNTTERFTERVIRLPRYCQYRPFTHTPDCAPPPVLRNGYVTFGCFSSRWKIGLPVVEAWARILTAVSGSRLLLKGETMEQPLVQAFHRERFAACGIAPERILFRGHDSTHHDHLAAYADIDMALDTFPYSYGNTAFEALWMGVPVVTLATDRFAGRMASSILTAAGLDAWVTHTPEAYETLAIKGASDWEGLRRARTDLRSQLLRSRLLDGQAYARFLERTYRWVWRRWCADVAAQRVD